jgi:RNA polymerase sigma factor (sigma-70 family)
MSAVMTEPEFGALAEHYRPGLYLHCCRVLGSSNDAEDALQDALLRGWRARGNLRAPTMFRPWMRRIATNACLDIMKTGRRRVPVDPDAVPEEVPSPRAVDDTYSTVAGRETLEQTVAVVQELPPRQRDVLLLRDLIGYEMTEVAELLDTRVTSVYSTLQRARRTLRASEVGRRAA